MQKQRILFIFNFGSEVRQFLHSGVIFDLLDNGHDIFISLRVKNDKILELIDSRITVLPYFKRGIPFYMNLIKEVLDEQNSGLNTWKYMSQNKTFKSKTNQYIYQILRFILRNGSKVKVIRGLVYALEYKLFSGLKNAQWENLFKEYSFDKIIVNVPNYNYNLLASAKQNKIPVYLAFHTNKDLYTLGRISFFYEKIGVWNEVMQTELLTINKQIKNEKVTIIGCSHFVNFIPKNQGKMALTDRLGIKDDDIVLLYIAAAPFVVQNEHEYIELLIKTLDSLGIYNFKVVVKVNPMDDSSYWEDHKTDQIIVMKSAWEWNKKEAFNYPNIEDITNFIDILGCSELCLGLPSTVVIESSLMQTPFLNICFNYGKVSSIYQNISEMWDAPFYKNVRDSKAAEGVFSLEKFSDTLKAFLIEEKNTTKEQMSFIKTELTFTDEKMKKETIKFIEE